MFGYCLIVTSRWGMIYRVIEYIHSYLDGQFVKEKQRFSKNVKSSYILCTIMGHLFRNNDEIGLRTILNTLNLIR